MNRKSALLNLASIAIVLIVGSGTARALHLDVLSEQMNGQIVTGTGNFDDDLWTLGERGCGSGCAATPTQKSPTSRTSCTSSTA